MGDKICADRGVGSKFDFLWSRVYTKLMFDRLDYPTKFALRWWSFEEFILRFLFIKSPPRWVCDNCGYVKFKEEEVICWDCGKGEMVYRPSGFLWRDS